MRQISTIVRRASFSSSCWWWRSMICRRKIFKPTCAEKKRPPRKPHGGFSSCSWGRGVNIRTLFGNAYETCFDICWWLRYCFPWMNCKYQHPISCFKDIDAIHEDVQEFLRRTSFFWRRRFRKWPFSRCWTSPNDSLAKWLCIFLNDMWVFGSVLCQLTSVFWVNRCSCFLRCR